MRNAFIQSVLDCAIQNKDVELVTGDLGFGVLKPFWETYPEQFINAGIAEQAMTGLAAGLARTGRLPWLCRYNTTFFIISSANLYLIVYTPCL